MLLPPADYIWRQMKVIIWNCKCREELILNKFPLFKGKYLAHFFLKNDVWLLRLFNSWINYFPFLNFYFRYHNKITQQLALIYISVKFH